MRSIVLALVATFALACSTSGSTTGSSTTTATAAKESSSPAGAGHAPKGAEPNSYEDWCGEHGVPESKCTRCNSSLIPAFKATKDWCEEHGLPESQCTKCNPGLKITRPPKKSGG